MPGENIKIISQNKKARHDYFIMETIEAGIELSGTEVKSVRGGKVNISDSYASITNSEVFLKGMNISPYEHGNIFNRDPLRDRKLLLHKTEIAKLAGKAAERGYTLMPLQVYFKNGRAKIEIGLCRGKKLYDKRQDIAKKDMRREVERDFKVKNL